MFILDLFDNNYRHCFGRFDPFITKEGLLPSFVISINLTHVLSYSDFELVKKISGYYFYKFKDNQYYFSLGSYIACMSNDFYRVQVFMTSSDAKLDETDLSCLLMKAFSYRLVYSNDLMVHSAAVVYHSECILFCGVSGAGKSTQANLWRDYKDAWVLNYDKPCIINNKDKYFVSGCPWGGKEELFINESYPLKAIVFVKQSNVNKVRRISYGEAYSNMFLMNYVYPFTVEIERKYDSVITDIISSIPVFELECTISKEAVDVLYETIF